MKFKLGDTVRVTAGKEKGKEGVINRTFPSDNTVSVAGLNLYVKHVRPFGGKAGERVRRERPLPTANITLINNKGEQDRIGYFLSKDGIKTRVFKKTGKPVPEPKIDKNKKPK